MHTTKRYSYVMDDRSSASFKKPHFDLDASIVEELERQSLEQLLEKLKRTRRIDETHNLKLKFELHLFLIKCQKTIETKLIEYNTKKKQNDDDDDDDEENNDASIVDPLFVQFIFDVRSTLYDIVFENWSLCKTPAFVESLQVRVQLDMIVFKVITSCTLVLLLFKQHTSALSSSTPLSSIFSKRADAFPIVTRYQLGTTARTFSQYTLRDVVDSLAAIERELNTMARYDASLIDYLDSLEGVLAKMWMYYQPEFVFNHSIYRGDTPAAVVHTAEDDDDSTPLYAINHRGWQELTSSFLAIRQRCWIHDLFTTRNVPADNLAACTDASFSETFWRRLKRFALDNNTSNVMRNFKPVYFFIVSRPSELSRFKRECPGKSVQWHKIIKRYRGLAALNVLQERYNVRPDRALEDGVLCAASHVIRDALAVKMLNIFIQNLISSIAWEQLFVRNLIQFIESPRCVFDECDDPLLVQDFNAFNVFFRGTLHECHCVACAFRLWLTLICEHNDQIDFDIVRKQFEQK